MGEKKILPFSEFVNKRLEEEKSKKKDKVDWNQRKKIWISFVNDFFKNVEAIFKEVSGEVQFKYDEKSIDEELLGQYKIKTLEVIFGGTRIYFEPIAAIILGSQGRIDLYGLKGKVMIILIDGKWHFAERQDAKIYYYEFTKEMLNEVLQRYS